MKPVRTHRYVLQGLLAASALALASISSFVVADQLKFKLTGEVEVPAVITKASGDADITINSDMTVSGKVMTSGISATTVHIHLGKAGDNGPVIITLVKSGDNGWVIPDGTKLSESHYKSYLAGGLYVNAYSAVYKSGEIRGQLKPLIKLAK